VPYWSTPEDSAGLIGPPRYGKTSGVILPALMSWDGPAVSTSTRRDVLRFTGNWRRQLAERRGGRIYLYDPFGPPAAAQLRWTPLTGCKDASVAFRRAAAMTEVVGRGITDGEHWRAGAAVILRSCLHAAALSDVDLTEVRRWMAGQDTRSPADVLRRAGVTDWADDLAGMALLGDRERGSFYSVARTCLEAAAHPRVRAITSASELDLDEFLTTSSTLYVVGPRHFQKMVAPLIVGLIDSIAERAQELADASPGGRLQPGLLLALDELANIAPLASVAGLCSDGGGSGLNVLWSVQSLAQLRARYGTDEQQAILTATTAKLIYGGMSNGADLRDISGWAGEYRETAITQYAGGMGIEDVMRSPAQPGGLGDRNGTGQMHAIGTQYRPVLPVDALQQLPEFHAWLMYRSAAPLVVETRPAGLMEPFVALSGYDPLPAAAMP
jgi:type IV secretory pathway TraG/TraD family ATPase VirD4